MANPVSSQLGGFNEQLGQFALGDVGFGGTDLSISLAATPAISFVVAVTGFVLGLSATPGVSFANGGTFSEALNLSATPGVSFVFQGDNALPLSATPGVSFSAIRNFPKTLHLSATPHVAFVIDGGAPAPPAPPAPPEACEVPPTPGYTTIATIYDEPSERIGS